MLNLKRPWKIDHLRIRWKLRILDDDQILATHEASDVSIDLPGIGTLPLDMSRMRRENADLHDEIAGRIRAHEDCAGKSVYV